MKLLFSIVFSILMSASTSLAGDSSELGGPLDSRIEAGCRKYAKKQAEKHLQEHFNMNFWAGGNVGAGSIQAMEEVLPNHESFLYSQCYNMVAEVLELKLGWGPWQNEK